MAPFVVFITGVFLFVDAIQLLVAGSRAPRGVMFRSFVMTNDCLDNSHFTERPDVMTIRTHGPGSLPEYSIQVS